LFIFHVFLVTVKINANSGQKPEESLLI